jgi:ubiquinol-cytochrome c reductase iron-sulfur subunit
MGHDLSRSLTRAALVVAAVASVAATAGAAVHAAPSVIGWLGAAVAFAAAFAAAVTARGLDAPADLREPREPHGPTRDAAPLPADVTRRDVFGRMWGLAGGAFALLALVPFVALARRPAARGTAWKRGSRLVTPEGRALRADDLVVGAVETVFPEGSVDAPQSATLLIRLPDNAVEPDPARRDWVRGGNIAYSKICTHAGCPVAIYREQSLELYCPCHQSIFDVVHGGTPVSGPATRALPQLALDIDANGYLIARGDFSEPIGPDRWDRSV